MTRNPRFLVTINTVKYLVECVEADEGIMASLKSFGALGPRHNLRLFLDRKVAQQTLSEEELRAELKAKTDRGLLKEALKLNDQLALRDHTYRIPMGSLLVAPDDDFVKSAMRPLDEIRSDIPSVYALQEVLRNVGSGVAQKQSVASKFFKKSEREGDVFDWWHLLGAAYCDAFVCDAYTSQCLANVREWLGHPKEFVFRGDYSGFARELRAAMHL